MSAPASALASVIARTLAATGQDVTYRLFVSSVLNVQTGQVATTYWDVAVKALQEPVSVREIALSGSALQLGDVRVAFAYADLAPHLGHSPSGGLSTNDRIVVDGLTWRVIAWELAANGTFLRAVARK